MILNNDSVDWALAHLKASGDTDLFPKPVELDALLSERDILIDALSQRGLSQFKPGPARRFMVPKDEFGFRRATQLHPLDSVILTAILYQFGDLLEARRPPRADDTVFSYRFEPQPDYSLYDRAGDWNHYWSEAASKCEHYGYALVLDVADFYNQIYHHVIENQLNEAGVANEAVKWIMLLLKTLTGNVSRGLPVGPHAIHLLAETAMSPVDNSFVSRGIDFIRFVDDLIIFEDSERMCRKRLYEIADILDKQQRLILNPSKTRVEKTEWLREHSFRMIEDRPINDLEEHLLSIVKKYSKGNPYKTVLLSDVVPEDLAQFSKEALVSILGGYLDEAPVNYVRLRWFLRRLTQIGHPGVIPFCLENLEKLAPAMADVCHYLLAASTQVGEDIKLIGASLIDALNDELIASSEYFQISLLSLFSRNGALNHFPRLAERYELSSPNIRREIILAARFGQQDWLRELKESFPGMDEWSRSAFLASAKCLPQEERRFFANAIQIRSEMDAVLKGWIKSN
jgi:hypothetical protein